MARTPARVAIAFVLGTSPCLATACSSESRPPLANTGSTPPDASTNDGRDAGDGLYPGRCPMPREVRVTVSGFVNCTCFNGTFTLTRSLTQRYVWSSGPIEGCPGQTEPAFLKIVNDPDRDIAFGLTGPTSVPGSGQSNYSPATTTTCSPLAIAGGGSQAGNMTGFCSSSAEDGDMKWSIE